MPKIRGPIFDTPKGATLFFPRGRSQQGAIATAHQSETGLSQANDPIAQIVRSPIPLGNAFGGEQDFCDFAIGSTIHPCIQRAQGERQPPPAMR